MMSLGANYTFAKPSSFVGNIGVIVSPLPPVVRELPVSGTRLLDHSSWMAARGETTSELTDQLKHTFGSLVRARRGDRLHISEEELLSGRIYSGIEGVRLGLVDGIGGDADAIEKAASLARHLQVRVGRRKYRGLAYFQRKAEQNQGTLDSGAAFPDTADFIALLNLLNTGEDSAKRLGSLDGSTGLLLGQALDRPLLSRAGRQSQEDLCPGSPENHRLQCLLLICGTFSRSQVDSLFFPLFALGFLLGAYFFFYRDTGGYTPPETVDIAFEQLAALSAAHSSVAELRLIQRGMFLVDVTHGNDFTKEEIATLVSRVSGRGYDVEVIGEPDFSGDSTLWTRGVGSTFWKRSCGWPAVWPWSYPTSPIPEKKWI